MSTSRRGEKRRSPRFNREGTRNLKRELALVPPFCHQISPTNDTGSQETPSLVLKRRRVKEGFSKEALTAGRVNEGTLISVNHATFQMSRRNRSPGLCNFSSTLIIRIGPGAARQPLRAERKDSL